MPRWTSLCKIGEESSDFYGIKETEEEFGIKNAFGPQVLDNLDVPIVDENGRPILKWNRCWSEIPKEWGPAIHELLNAIRAKYRVETLEDDEDNEEIEVWIDQIKCKYGGLRFYFHTKTLETEYDIETMVKRCEERLAKDDPFYDIPY